MILKTRTAYFYPSLLRIWPAFVIASILLAAWPGYLSFDSALQFSQARNGIYFDIAPPAFPWLWHVWLKILPATGGMLLMFFVFYAAGFTALAMQRLRQDQSWTGRLYIVLLPLCPPLLLLLPHLWTDVLLAACLLCCYAFYILNETKVPALDSPQNHAKNVSSFSGVRLVMLALLCGLAATIRHNSILAVLPFLAAAAWWQMPAFGLFKRMLMLAATVLAIVGFNRVVSAALIERKLDTWAVSMMFDLQAVSIEKNQLLLPVTMVGPGMSVAQLIQAYNPYSGTLLFSGTQSGVVNPTISPLSLEHAQQLRSAWLKVLPEPSFWAHRWRLMRGLFGTHRSAELRGLADAPLLVAYADNPKLERSFPSLHQRYRTGVETAFKTPIFSVGWLMLIALLLVLLRFRLLAAAKVSRIVLLLSSAWLYALPYVLVAPSAELRYVLWPALASWLALLELLPEKRQFDKLV